MLSWVASTAKVEVIKPESFSAKEVWTETGLSSFFFILMHNVFVLLTYPSPRLASNAAHLVLSFANHFYFYSQQNILPISLVLILFSIYWIFSCLLHLRLDAAMYLILFPFQGHVANIYVEYLYVDMLMSLYRQYKPQALFLIYLEQI